MVSLSYFSSAFCNTCLLYTSLRHYIHFALLRKVLATGHSIHSGFHAGEVLVAVSYTHLDVYKRQPIYWASMDAFSATPIECLLVKADL